MFSVRCRSRLMLACGADGALDVSHLCASRRRQSHADRLARAAGSVLSNGEPRLYFVHRDQTEIVLRATATF
jgi:hypothetical protein